MFVIIFDLVILKTHKMLYQLVTVDSASGDCQPISDHPIFYTNKNHPKLKEEILDYLAKILFNIEDNIGIFHINPEYMEEIEDDDLDCTLYTCDDKYDIQQIITNFNKELSENEKFLRLMTYQNNEIKVISDN